MNSIFIFINNEEKEFRQFKENPSYYVSADGDVYSTFSKKLLKHYIDLDGYHRVDIYINHKQKHIKIHKLVYLVWIGPIPKGFQINHYDDNKDHNHYTNLYLGTQKQNIYDCRRNLHRVGNVQSIEIKDKLLDKIITFPSISEFIKYSGHPVANGSLSKCLKSKWFHERFELISKKGVETIENYNQMKNAYNE